MTRSRGAHIFAALTRAHILVALIVVAGGCAPSQAEILLHVDTDAPVPPRPEAPFDPLYPNWLFDRLRVEVLRDGQPAMARGSRRDFAVDQGLFLDGKMSFGIAPPAGDGGLTVRLRLFRGDHATGGAPEPSATLDTTVALPAIGGGAGPVHYSVVLHTDDVGRPLGPVAPAAGAPAASLAGSWPGAQVVPCAGAPAADEVCIPGGAYWMGDPLLQGILAGQDANVERLVVIAPFFIGRHEVTVADLRQQFTKLTQIYNGPQEWNQSSDPNIYDTWCTYTAGPSAADPGDAHAQLSLNCIFWDTARGYCQLLGRDLPTEAQFEFAASGRGEERAYAWGDDEPRCGDAVYGRGGIGLQSSAAPICRTDARVVGAAPPGSGARDAIGYADLTTGEVRTVEDLAGNLAEWTRDKWSRQDEAYWGRAGVFVDPLANLVSPADGDLTTIRGGHWYDVPVQLRAAWRRSAAVTNGPTREFLYNQVGFRCVRPGK